MNIRFFMLGSRDSKYSRRLEEELKKVFAACVAEDGGVEAYDSVRDAIPSVKSAFSNSHVLMFLADPAHFAETKSVLSKALKFPLECNLTMLRKASATAGVKNDENSEFAFIHSYVPVQTRLFSAGDGLYTGFSVISGNQTIIIIPLERGRTDLLFSAQIIPYINSAYHVYITTRELKKIYADRLRAACVGKDITMALAGTNTAEFFKEYISFDNELDNRIVLSRKAEKRGNAAPSDYVVNLSIAASEFDNRPYGIAISNAYYTGESASEEKIIYVAVTNERETAVRKIHSVAGEDVSVFLTRCCSDICAFICDVIENESEREVLVEERVRVLKHRYIIAIIAAAVLLAGVTVFGITYFTSHDYSIGKWYEGMKNYLFPGSSVSMEGEVETLAPGQTGDNGIFDIITESVSSPQVITTAPSGPVDPLTNEQSGFVQDTTEEESAAGGITTAVQ